MGRLIQCQTLSHTFLNCFCTKNGEFGIGWQGPSGGDPPGLHQVRLKELLDILGNVLGTALVLAEEAEHPQGDVSAAPSMSQMLSRLSESPTPKSSVSLHKHPFNFYFFVHPLCLPPLCCSHTCSWDFSCYRTQLLHYFGIPQPARNAFKKTVSFALLV